MKKIILIMGIVFTLPVFAEAEHGVGNGGNAVVCYSDATKKEIKSIDLFDFWEMEKRYPGLGPVSVGAANASVREKIDIYNQRMLALLGRVQRYPVDYEFMKVMELVKGYSIHLADDAASFLEDKIPTIDDDNSPIIPTAPCYKEQLAVQFKDGDPNARRFKINKALYLHVLTDNDFRAGILMHEAIYRALITVYGEKNSDRARALNYLLATNAYEGAMTSPFRVQVPQLIPLLKVIELRLNQFSFIYLGSEPRPLTLFKNSGYDTILAQPYLAKIGEITLDIPAGKKLLDMSQNTMIIPVAYSTFSHGILLNVYLGDMQNSRVDSAQLSFDSSLGRTFSFSGSFGTVACDHLLYSMSYRRPYGCHFTSSKTVQFRVGVNSVQLQPGRANAIKSYVAGEIEVDRDKGFVTRLKATKYKNENGISLLSRFSSKPVVFESINSVIFDPDGYVRQADFYIPLSARYKNRRVTVKTLEWKDTRIHATMLTVEGRFPILYEGKYRVLSNGSLGSICAKYDAELDIAMDSRKADSSYSPGENVFVGAAEYFFDLNLGKLVLKKDEPVSTYTKGSYLICGITKGEVSLD